MAPMLAAAGAGPEDHRQPGTCVLSAYSGDTPAGIVAITTSIDTGRITLLWVTETMRRHGIGAKLIAAARKAAHTRGARTLSVSCRSDFSGYWPKLGFKQMPDRTWILDISRDGIIER